MSAQNQGDDIDMFHKFCHNKIYRERFIEKSLEHFNEVWNNRQQTVSVLLYTMLCAYDATCAVIYGRAGVSEAAALYVIMTMMAVMLIVWRLQLPDMLETASNYAENWTRSGDDTNRDER